MSNPKIKKGRYINNSLIQKLYGGSAPEKLLVKHSHKSTSKRSSKIGNAAKIFWHFFPFISNKHQNAHDHAPPSLKQQRYSSAFDIQTMIQDFSYKDRNLLYLPWHKHNYI